MEEKSAQNYRDIAITFTEQNDVFNDLAKENLKHRDRVIRAYRQGVTDAFEVGFNPNPINPDEYTIKTISSDNQNDVLTSLIQNEETIIDFCVKASKSSGKLLPDLPDTFEFVVRKKRQRIQQLNSMKV